MSTDTLKTIGWWILSLSVIALVSYGVHGCNKRKDAEREAMRGAEEKEYLQKLLTNKYLYRDINGVYHITNECGMLNDIYYTCDDEEKRGNYSSQYIKRSTITDWHYFAATHQLCSECFTPELIRQLDSVWMDYHKDKDKEYYNDNISKLYRVARTKGVLAKSLTEDKFRQKISTDEGLRSFYDYASAHGMKLRPWEDFRNKVREYY